MAMIYTLVSSAKDWLSEHYGQDDAAEFAEVEAAKEDEVLLSAQYFRYKLQRTSSLFCMIYVSAFVSLVLFLSKFYFCR